MGSSLPGAIAAAFALLLGGPGHPLARWGFEQDTDEWSARECRIQRTSSKASEGGSSLQIDVGFPRPATVSRRAGFDVDLAQAVVYRVYVPADAPEKIGTLFFLKSKDGLWFQHSFEEPLQRGAWNEVCLDISPTSPRLRPVGHHQVWSSVVAHRMEEIGIGLFCDEAFKGSLYLDEVVVYTAEPKLPPLAVVGLRESGLEVGRFEKLEVTFDLSQPVTNPFDPDQIRIDATFVGPGGTEATVPAFYYQDFVRRLEGGAEVLTPVGAGAWKVRFAPVALGPHSYFLTVVRGNGDEAERLVTGRRSFTCVESRKRGFVRVCADDPLYFEHEDGGWFYPIGHNVHSPSDPSPRAAAIQSAIGAEPLPDRGTFAYDELFRKMADNGENFAEVWMSAWWLAIEWLKDWKGYDGLGRYNLENAWKLDYLLGLAERHDLYLHLVIDNHGKCSTWCDAEWHDNPCNERNGGFLASPEDYFRSPAARELHRKRLRYIVARWAYSTRIAGFELWSEIDLVGDSWDFHDKEPRAAPKVAWHTEMADYLARIDPWRHPVTTHFSTDYRRIKSYLAALSGLRYLTCDAYKLRDRPIVDVILKTAETLNAYAKPGFVTEYGGKPFGEQSIPGLRADLHAGLWATYMTHTAGAPLLWWFQFIDRDDLYWNFKALAAYHRGEDRRGGGLERRAAEFPAGHPDLDALCLQNDRMAYAWVYSKSAMESMPEPAKAPLFQGIQVRLGGFQEGVYHVEIWDTWEGVAVAAFDLTTSAGQLTIRLPDFRTDCALKIKRAPQPPRPL